MYFLNYHFNSKNPFVKRLEDDEALKRIYMDSIKPSDKELVHDCPLTKLPISYSKYSLANIGKTGSREVETAILGKRLLKDYFEGIDVGIYARKAFQAQKLLEKFESIETAADFRHLKQSFQKEVVGSVERLKGGSVEYDEEEENEEAIDQYSEGAEESDYSNENSEFDHNSDSNQIAPLN